MLTSVWCLLVILTLIMAIKEIFQLVQAPLPYLISSENWGQWALIGSVFLTAWPPSEPELHMSYWQYPAAAVRNVFYPSSSLAYIILNLLYLD